MDLLAKSPHGHRSLSLLQHLLDTEQAASALFRRGTRWATSFLRFFKLSEEHHESFLQNLRTAALFHDLGKANADFQTAMRSRGYKAQSLRHEHLSTLLLCVPGLFNWLQECRRIDADVVASAVLSHHLKAAESGEWHVLQPRHVPPTELFFDDPQIQATFDRIAEILEITRLHWVPPANRYRDAAWEAARLSLVSRARAFRRSVRTDPTRRRMGLAVKSGLIAADSVSSGLVREGIPIEKWIADVAHGPSLRPAEIDEKIIKRRTNQITRTKPFRWHSFQEGAATVGRRGLILAPCGAGKTLAAWRWAAAISEKEPISRVIFLYPTRGTATEGFRDYVAHAPEGDYALVHGTSEYELLGMMENPPESLDGKQVKDEAEDRLYALGLWSKRFFSATVDQFLGFLEHGYKGMCLLPALADAAVILDEVHSYDAGLWQALLAFLTHFDVPVLCMTATLPETRRRELEQLLTVYPTAADMENLRDLADAESHPRYRVTPTTREESITAAVEAVRSGERVLWVVNTVTRCQEVARQLQEIFGNSQKVEVYHSRFRLRDRQDCHRRTVDAFAAPRSGDVRPALAVTTQVCEMSLDLDADVLVTEHAPISSLVQRFGRANRHLRRGKDFRARILTYPPESSLPYDREELDCASRFLAEISDQDVSQRALAEGLRQHSPSGWIQRGDASFLEGGYYAQPGNLRDSDDRGRPCIRDIDVEEYKALRARHAPADGLVMTVPKRFVKSEECTGLPSWLGTVDSAQYDPWLGFVAENEPQKQKG